MEKTGTTRTPLSLNLDSPEPVEWSKGGRKKTNNEKSKKNTICEKAYYNDRR
jgi:hypothetical protein